MMIKAIKAIKSTNLYLPTFVDFSRTSKSTRSPGTVGNPDEEGLIFGGTFGLSEPQNQGQEGGIDVPNGSEDKGDDREAGHAPNKAHFHLQQPFYQPFERLFRHSFQALWRQMESRFGNLFKIFIIPKFGVLVVGQVVEARGCHDEADPDASAAEFRLYSCILRLLFLLERDVRREPVRSSFQVYE